MERKSQFGLIQVLNLFRLLWVVFFISCLTIPLLAQEELDDDSTDRKETAEDIDEESPPLIELEEIVVTPTRSEREISDVPQKVTLITVSKIEESGAETVGELLRDAPGVQISSYGTTGSLQSVSIGGSSASQVLVLIDGNRVNDAQSGMVDFTSLPMDNIEKIEVLHGAASALYGANALGGVVNIITKKPPKNKIMTTLSAGLGSFNSQVYSLSQEMGLGSVGLLTSVKHTDAQNGFTYMDRSRKPQRRENNYYKTWQAFQKVDWDIDSLNNLSFSVSYNTADKGIPGSLAFPTPQATQGDDSWIADLTYKNKVFILEYLDLEAKAFYNQFNLKYKDPRIGMDSDHLKQAYGGEVKQRALIGNIMTFTYGYSVRQDLVGSIVDRKNGAKIEKDRLTIAVFLQDEIEFLDGDLSLIPAARYDHHSDFGGELSPKIGVVYNTIYSTTLRANYGLSFRPPTFNDLYWPEDAFAVGNPDLKPENGRELSLGATTDFDKTGSLGLTYFRNEVDNIIVWHPGQIRGKWAPVNIGKALLTGIEVEAGARPSDWAEVSLNYTYLEALNKEDKESLSDKQLPFKPNHTFNFNIKFSHDTWKAFVRGHYTGLRYSEPTNLIVEPPYFTLDVGASVEPISDLVISGEVKNALNEEYQSVPSYPSPGREFRINARYIVDWNNIFTFLPQSVKEPEKYLREESF